jgi:hypothetical protein
MGVPLNKEKGRMAGRMHLVDSDLHIQSVKKRGCDWVPHKISKRRALLAA